MIDGKAEHVAVLSDGSELTFEVADFEHAALLAVEKARATGGEVVSLQRLDNDNNDAQEA